MKNKFFKCLIIATLVLSVFVGVFALTACNNGGKSATLKNKNEIYGFMAVSGTEFLGSTNTTTQTVAFNANGIQFANTAASNNSDLTDEEINEIHNYLKIFDDFTGKDAPIKTTVKDLKKDNPDAKYANEMTITVNNASETMTFTMLYNETPLTNEKESDEDEDEKDITEDEEIETKLDGVMTVDTVEYQITGTREVEEGEIEIELTAKLNDNDYIVINQEIEDDEQEFIYNIYKDGKLSEEFAIELENEDGETEVEMTTTKDGVDTIYDFEKEVKDNKEYIEMFIRENGKEKNIEVIIEEVNGEKVYTYKVGDKEIEKTDED